MKNFISLLFIVLTTTLYGQSTITVFNNGGQQFYVILNGVKQNSIPQTNVSVSGIRSGSYSMKLIFADGKTSDIDKNFFLEEPSFVTTRVVFKKGKGKLQLIGIEPAGNQQPADNIVVYRPTDTMVFSDARVVTQTTNPTVTQIGNVSTPNNANGNVGINVNTTIQDPNVNNGQGGMNTSVNLNGTGTQQTTQQTTTSTNVNTGNPDQITENIGININMNVTDPTMNNGQGSMNTAVNISGTETQQTTQQTTTTTNFNSGNPNQTSESVGININMNVTDPTMNNGQGGVNMSINMSGTGTGTQTNQTTQQSTTVTTTTTTTSSGTTGNVGSNTAAATNSNTQIVPNTVNTNTQTTSSNQSIRCVNILGDETKMIAELEEMTFDEDKKEILIKDLEKHCLTASQAYKMIEIFTFEADRLELSKYLYLRMIDKDKGSSLLTLFTFDSSKMEFREYMRGVK